MDSTCTRRCSNSGWVYKKWVEFKQLPEEEGAQEKQIAEISGYKKDESVQTIGPKIITPIISLDDTYTKLTPSNNNPTTIRKNDPFPHFNQLRIKGIKEVEPSQKKALLQEIEDLFVGFKKRDRYYLENAIFYINNNKEIINKNFFEATPKERELYLNKSENQLKAIEQKTQETDLLVKNLTNNALKEEIANILMQLYSKARELNFQALIRDTYNATDVEKEIALKIYLKKFLQLRAFAQELIIGKKPIIKEFIRKALLFYTPTYTIAYLGKRNNVDLYGDIIRKLPDIN